MNDTDYPAIERRIEHFIVALGAAVTLVTGIGWGFHPATGAAIGAGLCWLNFRWLRQGAEGLIRLGLAQAGAETVSVPKKTHAKFFGRLMLLLVVVYVILGWLRFPAVPFVCGLAVVVPAILCELAYELMHGHHHWNAQ